MGFIHMEKIECSLRSKGTLTFQTASTAYFGTKLIMDRGNMLESRATNMIKEQQSILRS